MNPIGLDEIPHDLIERYLDSPANPVRSETSAEVRLNGVGPQDYADTLTEIGTYSEVSLALYIHVPFCAVRCHFCACNTNITHNLNEIDDYLDTLDREMDLAVKGLGAGRELSQLHIGGGTPNYLQDAQLARLMEIIDDHFQVNLDECACIECNPRRASASQLELLRELGFGCLSLGVQDLHPLVQRAIGRVLSLAVVRDVFQMARDLGFRKIQVDLVYGLPEQTEESLARTIEQMVALQPDRIRCFSYDHNPSRRLHQTPINFQSLPTPMEKISLFCRAVRELTQAGYNWIGDDCFARTTDDWSRAQAAGRLGRNSIGFTANPADYQLAFGPHGLGEIGSLFVQNEPDLQAWKRSVKAGRLPIAWGHRLSARDHQRRRAYEELLCNLMMPLKRAEEMGLVFEELEESAREGLLILNSEAIQVTPLGRFCLRSYSCRKLAALSWDSAQWRFPKTK